MSLEPNLDLDFFRAGKDALAAAKTAFDGRAFFASARRLQADGTFIGPNEGTCVLVEEGAVVGLGGLAAAKERGANAVLCDLDGKLADEVVQLGMRCLIRIPFTAGESSDARRVRLTKIGELLGRVPSIDGVMPTPVGEAQGLDTLQFFAACRLTCPTLHLVVDLELFGQKLGQLCLSFGANEILGSIAGQRALRLGAHASSNALTRDEAALLLRASGFTPCQRLPEGKVQAL